MGNSNNCMCIVHSFRKAGIQGFTQELECDDYIVLVFSNYCKGRSPRMRLNARLYTARIQALTYDENASRFLPENAGICLKVAHIQPIILNVNFTESQPVTTY